MQHTLSEWIQVCIYIVLLASIPVSGVYNLLMWYIQRRLRGDGWRGYLAESWVFMSCDDPPYDCYGRRSHRRKFWIGLPRATVRLAWFTLEYNWRVNVVGKFRALFYRPEPGAGSET